MRCPAYPSDMERKAATWSDPIAWFNLAGMRGVPHLRQKQLTRFALVVMLLVNQ